MWQCVDGRTEVRSENKGSDRGLKNPQTGAHKRLLLPSKPGSNLKAWNVSSGGEIQNKQKRNCAPWQVTFLLCKTLKNISYNWEKHRRNLCWLQSNVIQTVCDTSIGTVMSSAENVSKKIGLISLFEAENAAFHQLQVRIATPVHYCHLPNRKKMAGRCRSSSAVYI